MKLVHILSLIISCMYTMHIQAMHLPKVITAQKSESTSTAVAASKKKTKLPKIERYQRYRRHYLNHQIPSTIAPETSPLTPRDNLIRMFHLFGNQKQSQKKNRIRTNK